MVFECLSQSNVAEFSSQIYKYIILISLCSTYKHYVWFKLVNKPYAKLLFDATLPTVVAQTIAYLFDLFFEIIYN